MVDYKDGSLYNRLEKEGRIKPLKDGYKIGESSQEELIKFNEERAKKKAESLERISRMFFI